MKVLLTGGSGMIGLHVLEQLLHQKHDVTVIELFSKKNAKKLAPFKDKINLKWGSVYNKELVKEAIYDQNAVIHLASLLPPYADSHKKESKKVNYYGTKNIVDCINKTNPDCFLLYASSISVYGDRLKDYSIKVSDELKINTSDHYAFLKEKTEKMIQGSIIDYSIFRLSAVMDIPKLDPFLFHMPLDTKLEIITAKDVARAFVKALEYKDILKNNVYNLGGGRKCRTTYRAFLKKCFEIYGLKYKNLNEKNFARGNFHCGYYEDGDILNNILSFRRDTLDSYYKYLEEKLDPNKKMFMKLFSYIILKYLNFKSDFRK